MEVLPIDIIGVIAGFSLEAGDILRMCCRKYRDYIKVPPLFVNNVEFPQGLSQEFLDRNNVSSVRRGDLYISGMYYKVGEERGVLLVKNVSDSIRILRDGTKNLMVFIEMPAEFHRRIEGIGRYMHARYGQCKYTIRRGLLVREIDKKRYTPTAGTPCSHLGFSYCDGGSAVGFPWDVLNSSKINPRAIPYVHILWHPETHSPSLCAII